MDAEKEMPAERRFSVKRLTPLFVLAAGLVAFFAFGLEEYLTFDALRDNRVWLLEQVENSALLVGLIYVLIYIAVVAFSLPGAAVMTIAGGFLFGQWLGSVYVVVAATAGATILFVAAKTALGDLLRAKAGPFLQKMEAGFRENALSYLLVLRLVPIFPFFIVNLVPAFLGVSLKVFFVATLVGIIPGSFVYATVGAGLGSIFDSGEEFSPAGILTPEIITALIGLAVLALIPVVYKRIKARRS
ncbi:MAG: TVP38/TMEM64 family protein [Alphaproteobacteria bacterium]|nr:TVP38/TMEM64 family protein [Alphaproteobacteria bacterium]